MDQTLYQTHAFVHLNNIKENLLSIRKLVGNERKILVAVKANGYGHGAVEVSKLAQDIGINWLGIATVSEGIELRKAGITLPILKLSPAFPEEMEEAVLHSITLSICERENAKQLHEVVMRNVKLFPKGYKVHIKIDTGMGRIGVAAEDAAELCAWIKKNCPALVIEGVYTHFPVSDMPAQDGFTNEQINLFKKTVSGIKKAIGRMPEIIHAANSGGILGHPESWFDMVRPGIMTYGFYPDSSTPHTIELLPGMSLYSKVSFLKKIKKGTALSYGRTFFAPADGWVATFPAGYADGFNRLFSNRGRVLIRGRSFPIAGRVCMDQSLAYLGPELKGISVGDKVTLIGQDGGEEISVYEWAEKLGTITYEVTCQINARVKRYY